MTSAISGKVGLVHSNGEAMTQENQFDANDAVHPSLTNHAEARCRCRGTHRDLLRLLLDHADGETPVGGGKHSSFLSWDAEAELIALGTSPDLVRLARRRAVVQAEDGTIATVLVPLPGLRGRRYRRSAQMSARERVALGARVAGRARRRAVRR